nr:drug resistance transporter, Bcr/CflA subfamily [uncultured bacterium]
MKFKIQSLFFPFLLAGYEFSTYLSNDMYLPALPDMMREMHLTTQQVQFTLTSWFLGLASMPLFLGVLSDRFGRRPILLIGGIIYIIATVICALTHNHQVLLIARFLQGGMTSSMLVAGYATVHEMYDHKEAVRMIALMGSISVLAPTLGPLLGSIVLLFTSWRGIFWFIAIWATIAILLLIKIMPETLNKEQQNKINIPTLLKSYKKIISNYRFMALTSVLGCIFAGFITWIAAGPLLVIEVFQHSAIAFGLFQLAIFIAYIIGNYLVRYLVEKIKVVHLLHWGMSIAQIGVFMMLMSSFFFPQFLYGFIFSMMVFSFGTAFCFPLLNRMIIESSQETMGIRVSLFTVFLTLFSSLGSAASGLFFSGTIFSLACLVTGFVVLAYLFYFFVK